MTTQQIELQKQIEQVLFDAIIEAQTKAMKDLLDEDDIYSSEPDYMGKPGKYYYDTDAIIDKESARFQAITKAIEIMEIVKN